MSTFIGKNELIEKMKAKSSSEVTHKELAHAFDLLIDTIAETVKEGTEVRLQNFGTFHKQEKKARTARNPKTGEAVQVPAKNKFAFKTSGTMNKEFNA